MRTIALVIVFTIAFSTLSNAENWSEKVKIKGDLRYRHEMLISDKEGAYNDARHRYRIRARLAVNGKIFSDMSAVIQLATGSNDPVSTNQTLGESFSTKNVGVDLAYFEYSSPKLKGISIFGGKFKNPFFIPGKSELLWDSDWNPEGGAFGFNHYFGNLSISIIGSGLWIEEKSKDKDSYLTAGQSIARLYINENKSSFVIGGGYFFYGNIKDYELLYEIDDPMGNSENVTADTTVYLNIHTNSEDTTIIEKHTYKYGFEILELFIEASHKFNNIPVTVMADYVNNTAADSLNIGFLVGLRVGKAKQQGSWEFRYVYRKVEKDAVLGDFTDSDFRGGGTDARGHEIGGVYQLAENTAFKITYFINENDISDRDKMYDFNRLQVDLQLKF